MFSLNKETTEIIDNVVNHTYEAVTSTMGINGKLAIIANGTAVEVTKDGVTVARNITFADAKSEYVNKVISESAIKTDEECGDGTTTTVFLTKHLYDLHRKYQGFVNHRFIESLAQDTIRMLAEKSTQVTVASPLLLNLARTTANQDMSIANKVVATYKDAATRGTYPDIEVKDGVGSEDVVSVATGLPMSMYISDPVFSKDGMGGNTELKDFIPVVVDNRLGDMSGQIDQVKLTNWYLKQIEGRPQSTKIVFIARSIEESFKRAIARMNANIAQQIGATEMPIFVGIGTGGAGASGTALMGDLATIVGGSVHSDLESVFARSQINLCGARIVVNMDRGMAYDIPAGIQRDIKLRSDDLRKVLNETKGQDRYSPKSRFIEKRLRDLNGELVTVYVGGETISEIKERKARYVDVIKAVKSALVNGVLPGMGTSLAKIGAAIYKARFDPKNQNQEYKAESERMRGVITDYCHQLCKQYVLLLESLRGEKIEDPDNYIQSILEYKTIPVLYDMTTGLKADDDTVLDAAYASITALKGGLKVAKILATTNVIITGAKHAAVTF